MLRIPILGLRFSSLLAAMLTTLSLVAHARARWSEAEAQAWQAKQPPILTCTWPFGMVEFIWSLLALRKWYLIYAQKGSVAGKTE